MAAPGNRLTECFISPQELATPDTPSSNALNLPETSSWRPKKLRKPSNETTAAPGHTQASHVPKEGNTLPVHQGAPWKQYKRVVGLLDLGDKVFVAREHSSSTNRVGIRRFPRSAKEAETLSWFRDLRHPSIVSALEAFVANKILYIILEEMHMPLGCIIKCPRFPTSDELGVIMGQVNESHLNA